MDPKDVSWMEAFHTVNLHALQYKPGHQNPSSQFTQRDLVTSLAQQAYNLAWETSRIAFAAELGDAQLQDGSDFQDSGFVEQDRERRETSALSDFAHLADELDDIEQSRPSIEGDDDALDQRESKPLAGKAPSLAPVHSSASRNTYAVPLVSLSKGELSRICKHFRYRTEKFKNLSREDSKSYPIHLSLRECKLLLRDRKARGIIWEFKPPKSIKSPELYAKMAPINNEKYDLLQRRRIRAGLALRKSGERADDSVDESLSEDEGQYDSDFEGDGTTVVGKGEDLGIAADLGTPEIEMEGMASSGYDGSDDMTERADSEMRESSVASSLADENGRPYKGGKLPWPGPNGAIQSWNSERSESVESGNNDSSSSANTLRDASANYGLGAPTFGHPRILDAHFEVAMC